MVYLATPFVMTLHFIIKEAFQNKTLRIMEEFLANPGLGHIVRNISSFLDPKSLAQCRVVCHSWKDVIDNDRQWLIFQLEHIHKQENIFIDHWAQPIFKWTLKVRYPEWNTFIEEVSRRQNISRLKEMVNDMWTYFKDKSTNYYINPLHHAVAKSDIGFVQILIKSGINLEMKNPYGWTPLHYACEGGNIEMVQLLIKHTPTFDATSKTNTLECQIIVLARTMFLDEFST